MYEREHDLQMLDPAIFESNHPTLPAKSAIIGQKMNSNAVSFATSLSLGHNLSENWEMENTYCGSNSMTEPSRIESIIGATDAWYKKCKWLYQDGTNMMVAHTMPVQTMTTILLETVMMTAAVRCVLLHMDQA